MNQPFRFVQAGDFHLERPLRGLAEVPDHLSAALIDAPYRAAERVFDVAWKERVDFVILTGDLLDPLTSGPRALVFLSEQFQRLAAQAIKVYWALGRGDAPERWSDQWQFPDNVVRFPLHHVERIVHHRANDPVAQILGISSQQRRKIRAGDFHPDGTPLFSLAVVYGSADADLLANHSVNYWALGGEHDRRTLQTAPGVAHYAGSPQGRRPHESGPHGCTLVQVDETQRVRTGFIPTDAVRYQPEHITFNETAIGEQLQETLEERMGELLSDPFGPDLLVHWVISGSDALAAQLRRGRLAGELTARLRAEHGQKRPAAWTVSIEAETGHPVPADFYEEETLLGEFLRTVRHYVEHADDPLDLEPLLAQRHSAGSLSAAVALDDPAVRERVLAEVARLGVDLLGPQERRA